CVAGPETRRKSFGLLCLAVATTSGWALSVDRASPENMLLKSLTNPRICSRWRRSRTTEATRTTEIAAMVPSFGLRRNCEPWEVVPGLQSSVSQGSRGSPARSAPTTSSLILSMRPPCEDGDAGGAGPPSTVLESSPWVGYSAGCKLPSVQRASLGTGSAFDHLDGLLVAAGWT